jgi:two-component system osmolarity sensor histidine kinase EnvZ
MMPANLFGRTLLILLLPIVLLQLMMALVFYERHWDSVVRNMASTTAADVGVLVQEYRRALVDAPPEQAIERSARIAKIMGIEARLAAPETRIIKNLGKDTFPDFYRNLDTNIATPFMVKSARDGRSIRVSIQAGDRVIELIVPAKRLASATTYIFILWMVGSSLLLVLIAALFLRNQIRPIVQLARAAEQFGLGHDVQNFIPRGANEIRRAGRSFLIMAERIRRQVASRTEMLAGISHDLRTPLTRMQLEIEMAKLDAPTRNALVGDIEEMRSMIDEYLDFARGDSGEPMEPMPVDALVAQLVEQYQKQGAAVTLGNTIATELMLRPQAIRRALTNLIDNALRYGKTAVVSMEQSIGFVRIKVTDQGPGIPDADQKTVFKPFTRLEPSRNSATGGVGLGLSIARDIAQNHGGDVSLENRRDDAGEVIGLEVTLRLPRQVQVMG